MWRHDADDLIVCPIEFQGVIENVAACTEHGEPEGVADEDGLRVGRLLFFRGKRASQFRTRLQGGEEILVDTRAADAVRGSLLGNAELRLFEVAHVCVGIGLTLEVVEVAIAGTDDFGRNLEAGIGREEIDQLPGIAVRQGSDEHGVHEAEDGCAGADAEGQCEYGGEGEGGAFAQGAQAVAEVLEGLFDPQEGALIAMGLLGLFHSGHGTPGGEACFFRRQAAALEVVGEQSEMRCDFAREILFGALVREEAAEFAQASFQPGHGYGSSASSFSTTLDI